MPASAADLLDRGERLIRDGALEQAAELYAAAASAVDEDADGEVYLALARAAARLGKYPEAAAWLGRLVDTSDSFRLWQAGAALVGTLPDLERLAARAARVAVVGSYTTAQFVPMLRLAALRAGLALELTEGGYDQFEQEILDEASALYRFDPGFVVLAVHEGALNLPPYSDAPAVTVDQEVQRWVRLWQLLSDRGARVVQHGFVPRPGDAFGHLAARLPGSRRAMVHAVNAALGAAAGDSVLLVDCDRIAATLGTRRWFDDRYWDLAKQAVSLDALPDLARSTAAVIAGDVGLAKKCIVLDLDNTLWGGVVGEDGLDGIRLGAGAEGEAFVRFQEALLGLKRRGVLLAVCSKNNEADAREALDRHPDMRIRPSDLAALVASWENKADTVRAIAAELGIGLDSIVFIDDNPAERELVRRELPAVDVLSLPADPALYARALEDYPYFETSSYSSEDARRTDHYRARARAAELAKATDLDSFLESLEMAAEIGPFDEFHLNRIVQLIGKTNQFNLTTRRHDRADVLRFMDDPDWVHLYLKLRDRFVDHGLVGVTLARRLDGDVLDIDTFLLSCRVIGRTAERALLAELCHCASALGCTRLRGTYVPTAKNGLVREMFGEHGFTLVDDRDGVLVWDYDLSEGEIASPFVSRARRSP